MYYKTILNTNIPKFSTLKDKQNTIQQKKKLYIESLPLHTASQFKQQFITSNIKYQQKNTTADNNGLIDASNKNSNGNGNKNTNSRIAKDMNVVKSEIRNYDQYKPTQTNSTYHNQKQIINNLDQFKRTNKTWNSFNSNKAYDNSTYLSIPQINPTQLYKHRQSIQLLQSKLNRNIQIRNQDLQHITIQLNKIHSGIEHAKQQSTDKIQSLYDQIKQFYRYVSNSSSQNNIHTYTFRQNRQDQNSSSAVPSVLKPSQKQYQHMESFKDNKIVPTFNQLRHDILKCNSQCHKQLSYHQHKLEEELAPEMQQQQKQAHEQLLRVLNVSNNIIYNLEEAVKQYNTLAQDKLCYLEDKLYVMEYDLEREVSSCIQSRCKEDKFIELLIQKMIYKMTYL